MDRSTLTPSKRRAFDDENISPMSHLLYLETLPKKGHKKFMKGQNIKPAPIQPSTRENLQVMSPSTKQRHEFLQARAVFSSWHNEVLQQGAGPVHTIEMLRAAHESSMPRELYFEHDKLIWFSDCRIFVRYQLGRPPKRTLSIHLPNNGFFYKEEGLQPVKASKLSNSRHRLTCPEGWAELKVPEVWSNFGPLETMARDWYGCTEAQQIQKTVLYNADANRMDICMDFQGTEIAVEFSFEPGYFVRDTTTFFFP